MWMYGDIMKITDVERSLFKYLYDNLEVPSGIKIFDSVFYVDFTSHDKWVVLDPLSNSNTSTPRANFSLHISIKNGLRNASIILSRLVDTVSALFPEYKRIAVYSDQSGTLCGEMEVCALGLLPTQKHVGGGEFRTLSVSVVYPGEVSSG